MKYFALLALAASTGCSDTTDVSAGQLNLNRPVDIAFACYGGLRLTNGSPATVDQQVTSVPQPISSCDIRSQAPTDMVPTPVPPGQEDLTASGGDLVVPPAYYAFILQSAPGTVEIATWQTTPVTSFVGGEVTVIDADPLTPGVNGISIGEEPIAIQTDDSGCFEVTANAGSCDMSVLDINTAVSRETKAIVTRQPVLNAANMPIRAKPAAMVAQPPIDKIGQVCEATPQGIMYVAYPSCHLVAAVDVSAGKIVGGIKYDSAGVATILPDGNITCPIDECGGGGTVTPGPRPVTLDLKKDARSLARRLVIGSQNSNTATIVELDASYLPQTLSSISFQDPKGNLGLTTVTLTPQIGMGGQTHFIVDDNSPGGEFQFIYAVATDNSVRVADVLSLNKECDTQVDPRFAYSDTNIKQLSCFPVGDPATPQRRAGATGPGIVLPNGIVPTSVSTFKSDIFPDDSRLTGGFKTIGYFGLITGSDGHTFVVNVDDDDFYDTVQMVNPLLSPVPLILAHQLRDALPNRGAVASINDKPSCFASGTDPDAGNGNDGGPRTDGDPTRGVPAGLIADVRVPMLPMIRHVDCSPTTVPGVVDAMDGTPVSTLSFDAPVAVRALAYPDLMGLSIDETWVMTWEGSLSNDGQGTAVDGPGVRESVIAVDADAMRLVDDTGPFCDAGVEPYDIVQLRGCDPANQDRDCPTGYECFVHPQSQVTGLGACMLATEADRLANACKEYLTSLRRYTVGPSPTTGQLVLLPRRHHLRNEPLDGCDLANDTCQQIGDYAAQLVSTLNPRDAGSVKDPHTYVCAADDLRPARAAGKGSCLESCSVDSDCVVGTVCAGGFCMEGVTPPQACVNAPQRYEVRAHNAFSLIGSQSGYVHPIIADGTAAKTCIKNPTASPTQIGRVPLTAPPCDPTADPRTGALPGGGFEPNPCLETTTEADLEASPDPGTCAVGTPVYNPLRPTTAIKFRDRGMQLELVDPTSPGDKSCTMDRLGNGLGNLPLVFTGYQLSWRVTAGFVPLTLPIAPSYPVKVVTGPGQSMWVVDEGDYLSTTLGLASTLGKVFRVEAQQLSVVNTLQ